METERQNQCFNITVDSIPTLNELSCAHLFALEKGVGALAHQDQRVTSVTVGTKFCATVDRHLVPKMTQYQDFGKVRREGSVRTRCEQVKRMAAG